MKNGTTHNRTSESVNQRGIELADRGWLDEALREFDQAIALDGNAPFPRINRASVYMEQGRMLEALGDLLAAVQMAPDDSATRYHLGLFLTRFGSELGLRELQTTLTIDPDHIDALLQMGATHAERGEFAQAEEALEAALEIDPLDPQANREKGILLLDRGQVHEAIDFLRTAQENAADDLEIRIDLGLAYLQAGFPEQAARALEEVLQKWPDNLPARYNLAALLVEQGHWDPALEHLACAMDLDRSRVLDWLADDPKFSRIQNLEEFRRLVDDPPDMG